MTNPLPRLFRRSSLALPGSFGVVALTFSLAGCAAMEGVNVGARVPIGGVVDVGMNKTIGRGQSPAPASRTPPDPEEPADTEDEAPEESGQEQ